MSNAVPPAALPFSADIFTAGETFRVSTAEELSILAAVAKLHGWLWTVQNAALIIAKAKDQTGEIGADLSRCPHCERPGRFGLRSKETGELVWYCELHVWSDARRDSTRRIKK
jgi:hypothetical protein